jgi:hypothetical protein
VTVVLLVGDDTGGRLAAQLVALPVRRPLTVAPFHSFATLPEGEAVALLSASLAAPDEVLLRLLDDLTLTVAALVGPPDGAAADVATQGLMIQSAATAQHPLADADSVSLGAVLAEASAVRALRGLDGWTGVDPVDLALAALVRAAAAGPVTAVRVEPFPARRDGGPRPLVDDTLAARSAARPGDGFYSTFVLRRISARLTPWFVRHRVPANAVTSLSFAVGVAAGVLFGLGAYASLVAGALLLQVSLVLDCVDGEIARATRTRTPFGAWLDGATDRIKEYGALAGLAFAAHGLWWLATLGMAIQTVRHVQDFAFDKGVLAGWRTSLRDRRPLSDTSAWVRPTGSTPGPERLTGSPSTWLKRVIRMPIAERWLVLSICALIDRPWLGLTLYACLTGFAWFYTLPGAFRRSRRLPDASSELGAQLFDYRDDGLLAGVGFIRVRRLFLWFQVPVITALETGLVIHLVHRDAPDWDAAAFGWVALVAWHRYDLIYRRGAVSTVVGVLGLGWFARYWLVSAVDQWARDALPGMLVVGIIWFGIVYLPESFVAGLRTAKARRG